MAQAVEPEGVAFAAFVDDLAQLQLAVVAETHVAAELPPARERAQRAVVELHVVQHVRGLDEVARGVVREVVHVAVRLLDAYKVVSVVVGVGRHIPKHVARPHHADAPVVPPVAVQSVGEGEPLVIGEDRQVISIVTKFFVVDGTFCTYFLQSHRNSFTIDNGLCHKFEINRRIVLVQFVETASN